MNSYYDRGFNSVLPFQRLDAGKPCGNGYIAANKKCGVGEGKKARLKTSAQKEWYDLEDNIDLVYREILGGDRMSDDIARKNNISQEKARNYQKEMARAWMISQEDPDRGDEELKKVNKKYWG